MAKGNRQPRVSKRSTPSAKGIPKLLFRACCISEVQKSQSKPVLYNECGQRKHQALGWLYQITRLKLVMKQHREIPSHHVIKSCTVSRTKTGKHYISILTEYEHQPVQKEVQAVVGLDFSMNGLFVDSEEGKTANYPHFYRQALEQLAKEQPIVLSMETRLQEIEEMLIG